MSFNCCRSISSLICLWKLQFFALASLFSAFYASSTCSNFFSSSNCCYSCSRNYSVSLSGHIIFSYGSPRSSISILHFFMELGPSIWSPVLCSCIEMSLCPPTGFYKNEILPLVRLGGLIGLTSKSRLGAFLYPYRMLYCYAALLLLTSPADGSFYASKVSSVARASYTYVSEEQH